MEAAMSTSCCASSLRLIRFKTLISPPLKPSEALSFRRTIVTFQKISTGIVRPPPSASSSSSPSSSDDLQPIEELPPKLQEMVKLFQSVQDPRAKYEQLIFYGNNLKPLDPQFKTRENKVQGCVSQVWVRAFFNEQRNVVYEADSDAVLTKGLAALLVMGLSGSPVPEILRVTPDFALLLGLQQTLSPSRSNGFFNMLKLMQKKALQLQLNAHEDTSPGLIAEPEPNVLDSVEDLGSEKIQHSEPSSVEDLGSEKIEHVALGPRGIRIREILDRELNPADLQVEDVSYQHTGHAAVRGTGSDGETHFNLRIVSDAFQGKSSVKRHRLIYDLLQHELNTGLHALSIVAKTPTEL